MLNVKYLITDKRLYIDRLKLVYDCEVKIYQNIKAMNRVYIIKDYKIVKNKYEILDEIRKSDFNPRKYILIEEEIKENINNELFDKINSQFFLDDENYVKILSYTPNRVLVNVCLPFNGFLVLADSYYPGWVAKVDGKKSKIYRTNYVLRAIYLPKGKHTVEFAYKPESVRIGFLITSIGILISITILLIDIRRKWIRKQN
jgi:uncharacterized membrane protein YfhO